MVFEHSAARLVNQQTTLRKVDPTNPERKNSKVLYNHNMNNERAVIEVDKLSKRYAGSESFALKSLSLKIMPGEVYGFLGPNGAGKSTTTRLLMNFIQPTSGSAQIAGRDIVNESVKIKSQVGYLSGDNPLYGKMTGHQFLEYMGELQPPKRRNRVSDLAKLFKLDLSQPIHTLSKGNRQKVGLVQAFAHEPDVMILDEPTSGLDPLMQEVFYGLVRDAKDKGVSIFVSSHNLAEVQKMCDRVGFIRSGKLIAEQTISDLASSTTKTFDITFDGNAPIQLLKKIKSAVVTQNSPRHATVQIRGDLSPLFAVLARHKVHSLENRDINLEEEFIRFYKEGK